MKEIRGAAAALHKEDRCHSCTCAAVCVCWCNRSVFYWEFATYCLHHLVQLNPSTTAGGGQSSFTEKIGLTVLQQKLLSDTVCSVISSFLYSTFQTYCTLTPGQMGSPYHGCKATLLPCHPGRDNAWELHMRKTSGTGSSKKEGQNQH